MGEEPSILFYDGECAFCHAMVRFMIKRDSAKHFFYAPRFGRTFEEKIPGEPRQNLPDSVFILTPDGRLLDRGDATLAIYRRLAFPWPIAAALFALMPRAIRDWLYKQVQSVRYKIFGRAREACPLVPEHLRERLLP